jgi:hypothetical protein
MLDALWMCRTIPRTDVVEDDVSEQEDCYDQRVPIIADARAA